MPNIANPRMTFDYASDPSHGLIIVTPGELIKAGLCERDISRHSYRDPTGEPIALEEDCDAPTFINAYEAATGGQLSFKRTELHSGIRLWESFGTKQ